LAKLALITYLARTLSRKQENIKDVKNSFIPIMGSVCVVFALIASLTYQPRLMLFGVSILLLIMGRISIKQIAVVCVAGLVLTGRYYVFRFAPRNVHLQYQHVYAPRELADPDKSFQAETTQK
jgi:cell division protein FtsW